MARMMMMRAFLRAFAVFVAVSFVVCHGQTLNVLSFNVRQFGQSKYSKQDVIDTLIQIVQNYDLALIIELVDVSQTVLPGFTRQLNQAVAGSGIQYNYSVSERVGRSVVKEQYAFLYRVSEVEILNSYQYPDSQDMFERPPYSVLVRTLNKGHGDLPAFFLIASHTKPSDAPAEINHLDDVFVSASNYFSTSTGFILGDLNADCSYLSQTRYNTLDLVLNTSFTWWINNSIDTTTGTTNCAYDRIISWSALTPYIVNGSASVVLFDSQYQLTSEQTAAVSDHYPVTISLKGKAINSSSACIISLMPIVLVVLTLLGTLVVS